MATLSFSKLLSLSSPTTLKPTSFLHHPTATLLRRHSSFPTLSLKPTTATSPLRHFSTTSQLTPGDKLPDCTLSYLDPANEVQTISTTTLTSSKKTILFAVPGAFTPTCTQKHLPSFLANAALLKSKGVAAIACVSVNDVFVMKAWKDSLGVKDEDVLLLSDGNGDFTRAIGAELDLSDKPVGLGVRSRRYAMLVEDGVVKVLNMEEGGAFTFTGAEDMLKVL